MCNTLRNLLLGAVIGLSVPEAVAQSESFTGLSGNSYYVDYVSGLVMRLDGNDATIISPDTVVESEFETLWGGLLIQGAYMDNILDVYQNDLNYFDEALQLNETLNQEYWNATSTFTDLAAQFGQQYSYLFDFIEQIVEQRGAAKPAKAKTSEPRNTTNFSFNISGIISAYEYNQLLLTSLAYLIADFESSLQNAFVEISNASDELDDMTNVFNNISNYHAAYIQGVYEWLEQNAESAEDEVLYQVAQDIAAQVQALENAVNNIPANPTDNTSYLLTYLYDYMMDVAQELDATSNRLIEMAEVIAVLKENFAGVLFAGPQGDEVGLYYSILNNNGCLVLPQTINFSEYGPEETEYTVRGINGNIFSGMPEGFTINDLKLSIPETVTHISDEAFAIDGIREVTVPCAAVPSLDINCFTNSTYSNANLYVKGTLVEDYRNDVSWGKFKHILPETTGVNDIIVNKTDARIDGDRLIMNAPAGSLINVYTVDGKSIYTGHSGSIQLPARGIYIVKTVDQSIKIRY